MKIYLKNQENFYPETIEFYKNNFELVKEKDAEIIVINDFKTIETDKIVACNSTGIDHINAFEIISLRGEDLSDLTAVAELCLGKTILLTRTFKKEEIRGKTLGIIGYGRIGKQFEIYAKLVGMNVYHFDKEEPEHNLYNLLYKSDIVSLHISANEENRNFFKKEYFEQMKDGAIFLNSTRPWLVEEKGLKWALDNKLAGAWFDFKITFIHPKLVTTNHLGGTTLESRKKSEMILAKKILKLYGGK